MYAVSPQAARSWAELFEWLARASGVELDVLAHAFPSPLSSLWSRSDLGCAFMCGYPFMLASRRPRPVAAPVPSAGPLAGRPFYATRLLVRADSRLNSIDDTFGGRLGYTVTDSHSGYNALRHHLLPYHRRRGEKLYRQTIGPLTTPPRVIEAILDGWIDVGPVDGYAYDLMVRHESHLADQLRVIATTDAAPIPFMVAAQDCPDDVVSRLQNALVSFGSLTACAGLRERLCLEGFTPVDLSDYELIMQWDAEARQAGYYELA